MKHLRRSLFAPTLLILCSSFALAQDLVATENLPDAPGFVAQAAAQAFESASQLEAPQGTAQVEGTVLGLQGDPIPGAKVILSATGKLGERSVVAGEDGSFAFTGLPAAAFRLIIEATGFETYTSSVFAVKPGETIQVPKTALKIANANTSVDVFATNDQVAIAQVHEQEKQRVLGVFPNFYTSYIWKAEPMPARQKYKLAVRALVDPVTFLIVAGVAGAEHFNGTYPGYGPGIEGYGKRYGAAFGDAMTSRIVGSAILPSVLHQDPRYFYQGSGGVRSRTWHALASTLICRGDNGKSQPNYSHVLGSLAAGGLANLYHPESSEGLGLTFETLGITTAGNAVGNLVREFVLRGLVPTVPDFANGK